MGKEMKGRWHIAYVDFHWICLDQEHFVTGVRR